MVPDESHSGVVCDFRATPEEWLSGSPRLRAVAPKCASKRGPHHEAQVRPSGEDVGSELIMEVHVLIDESYVLFVGQKVGAQPRSQQEQP
jgi:hypothetical protein